MSTTPSSQINPLAQAGFLSSAAQMRQLPDDDAPEVAFVGRSNAGKSSALNLLCEQRALARVSKTPGRTQLINLFILPAGPRLVDLPGYGFAKVPEAIRRSWQELAGGYVSTRDNLSGLVLLMDIRHPLTPLDMNLLTLAQQSKRPVLALLTKCDKLGRGAQAQAVRSVKKGLPPEAIEITVAAFSAKNGTGADQARAWIAERLGIEVNTRQGD